MSGILVLHPGALGDIVLALPALSLVRERFPGMSLTFAGNSDYAPAVVFGYAERTAALTTFPLHRLHVPQTPSPEDARLWNSFDRIISWTGFGDRIFEEQLRRLQPESMIARWRPGASESRHVSRIFVESLRPWLGEAPAIPPPRIRVRPEDRAAADAWLDGSAGPGAGRIVAIHPGAGNLEKRWPHAHYAAVVRALAGAGCRIVAIEGPAEPGLGLDLIRGLSAGQATVARLLPAGVLAGVLARCAAFVGNDSGIAHLAAGLGVPSVVLFGPTSPGLWGPLGPCVEIIRDMRGCRGCTDPGRPHECLMNIAPETVLGRLASMLSAAE